MRWLLGLILASALPARADDGPQVPPQIPAQAPTSTPFDRGKFGISLGAGRQSAFGENRIAIGGGVGYFVLDGVELGLSTAYSFGDGPGITKLSPALTYVAQPLVYVWPVVPYVGTFYKHWFVGANYADVDSIGARAGLEFVSGQLVLGLGLAFERVVSMCTTDCDAIYPDVSLGLAL